MFGLITRNDNCDLRAYDPFREMEALERAFFRDPFPAASPFSQFRTDVTDEGDCYLLETDLPGFEKKDIHLDIQDDILTISAERHARKKEKDRENKVVRMERSYGSYSRSFDLTGINADKIKAKYEDGVLRLTLPKTEQAKSRRLEIE